MIRSRQDFGLRLLSMLTLLAISAWAQPVKAQVDPETETHSKHTEGHAPSEGHSPSDHRKHTEHGNAYQHQTMHHDFSDAEQWSARFDNPERKAWQKPAEVVRLMDLEIGMTVADLGAGTGYFLGHLSAAVGETGRVLGLDPEGDMVRFMGERTRREGLVNVEPRQIPFDDPELAADSVDRVLIVNTWHHIQERGAYAGKLAAALRPGSAVYIVDFTRDSPSGPPVSERLDPQQVIDELTQGGLQAQLIEEELPRQYVVVGRRQE